MRTRLIGDDLSRARGRWARGAYFRLGRGGEVTAGPGLRTGAATSLSLSSATSIFALLRRSLRNTGTSIDSCCCRNRAVILSLEFVDGRD